MAARTKPLGEPTPPEVIAFDLYGTLFSLESLEPLLVAAGADPATARLWFSRVMADGFALTAARQYEPFRDVAKASLREVLPKAKAAARDKVLAGLAKLEVCADSAPAMGRTVMNARVGVLSNASTDASRKLVAKGRLEAFVETIVSAEDVNEWRPGSDAYAFMADQQGVPLQRLAVVTVHPWDVLGAKNAGLVAGWLNRDGRPFPSQFGKPDVTGTTMVDVVEALFALRGVG
jgi:2-haloacid dehalogenase